MSRAEEDATISRESILSSVEIEKATDKFFSGNGRLQLTGRTAARIVERSPNSKQRQLAALLIRILTLHSRNATMD
jgi:hypothetical protein